MQSWAWHNFLTLRQSVYIIKLLWQLTHIKYENYLSAESKCSFHTIFSGQRLLIKQFQIVATVVASAQLCFLLVASAHLCFLLVASARLSLQLSRVPSSASYWSRVPDCRYSCAQLCYFDKKYSVIRYLVIWTKMPKVFLPVLPYSESTNIIFFLAKFFFQIYFKYQKDRNIQNLQLWIMC